MTMVTESRIERLTRLQSIPDDDQIDPTLAQVRRLPDRRRILTDDQKPLVDLEVVLVREVDRLETALEVAREDLRRYRMSHGNDARP